MSTGTLASLAPVIVFVLSAAMLFAPAHELRVRHTTLPMVAVAALLGFGVPQADAAYAYAALALTALIHASTAWRHSKTGSVTLVVSGVVTAAGALAIQFDYFVLAFSMSLLAIALRAGVMPLHVGIAHLAEKAPALQAQQFASTLALVFLHLRFVDHHPTAYEMAPLLVRFGAALTLVPTLLALRSVTRVACTAAQSACTAACCSRRSAPPATATTRQRCSLP